MGRPKTLVILAAVFLVSAGLCGLQWNVNCGGLASAINILLPLGLLELAAMIVSGGWILIVSMVWAAEALNQRFGKPPKDELQKLFGDEDETKNVDEP
jgi:hypothetical protein